MLTLIAKTKTPNFFIKAKLCNKEHCSCGAFGKTLTKTLNRGMDLPSDEAVPLPFEAASTACISGATKSGKTTWLFRLLKNKKVMFSEPVKKILYCYGIYQDTFDAMKRDIEGIEFLHGVPTQSEIEGFADGQHNLVILDDLSEQVVKDPNMERLFIQGAHHLNLSVFFVSHNCFRQGKCARTIALNTHYTVLFRNIRDGQQISLLGKQMYPGNNKALVEAYEDATSSKYGYLVIDSTANGEDVYRLRTKIFPAEDPWVYVPINYKSD